MAKYSYNGVILPEIPSSVLAEHPYAVLVKATFGSESVTQVFCNKTRFFFDNVNPNAGWPYVWSEGIESIPKVYMIENDSWVENAEYSGITAGNSHTKVVTIFDMPEEDVFMNIVWVNHDMYYIDADTEEISTEIYLAASEPISYIESSSEKIMVSDEYYKNISNVCRNKLGVTTKYKPSELTTAINSLSSFKDYIFDESLITNGAIYTDTDSGFKFVGNRMTPGCCAGMKFDDLTISGNFTNIAKYAFANTNIGSSYHYDGSLVIAEGITTIEENAFHYARIDKRGGITFPNGLKTIKDNAFYSCYFWYNTEIVLPNMLETIGEYAFSSSDCISYIVIPNSVISMGNSVFALCEHLIKADISANITDLPLMLFYGCKKLDTLILRKTDAIYNYAFYVIYNTLIESGTGYIYVPSALIDTYKADSYWSTYAAQFRAIEDYPDICGTT